MRNGVFFRLALSFPKKAIAAWKKAKLREQRQQVPGKDDAPDGTALLGAELSVKGARTLKAALAELQSIGMDLERGDVAHWEKADVAGGPGVRIETRGALKREATVRHLLEYLQNEGAAGEEYVEVAGDGKDGQVEVLGYLGGYDAYGDHYLPLLLAGAAAGPAGGTGTLGFLGDTELTSVGVYVRAVFGSSGVQLAVHPGPEDLSEAEVAEIEAGFGEGGTARIEQGHAAWLERFVEQKRKRLYSGCVGWLRPDGTFAIEPRYGAGGRFSEGLAGVAQKGSLDCGYIDERGELAIPFEFASVSRFAHGRALVERDGKGLGYIDRSGRFVVEPRYPHAEDFCEERAVVGELRKRGYIDLDGKEIVRPRFRYARPFADGMALVADHDEHETGGFGFVDREGKVAIPLALERAGVFHKGYAIASRGGLWGFLDRSGEFLFPPRFTYCGWLVDDRGIAQLDGKWGLVDGRGDVVMPHEHSKLYMHHEWFVSDQGDHSVFFDRNGQEVFRVRFTVFGELRDDHMTAATGHGGPFGYVHRSGRVVSEARFRLAAPFSRGLALAADGDTVGILDHACAITRTLDLRLHPACAVGAFADNGLAWVQHYSRFGLVNRAGEIVCAPQFAVLHDHNQDLIYAQFPVSD
jgi:hypothetical protein